MEIVDRRVPLSQIGKTVGPAPVSRFIGNVQKNGVVIPVLLREAATDDGSIHYTIVDGNRRVAAARNSSQGDVPARILTGISEDDAARMTLAANVFRSTNHISEFWAIKHLERSGLSRQSLADASGLSPSTLDIRNRLSTLDRRIFVGFAEGKISTSVAIAISRLPRDDQRELGDLFALKGRILTNEVRKAIRHTAKSGQNGMKIPTPPAHAVVLGPTEHHDDLAGLPAQSERSGWDQGGARTDIARSFPAGGLPFDVQQALETAVIRAYPQGIALSDLSDALAVAYQHVDFVGNVTKEENRGRDYQS